MLYSVSTTEFYIPCSQIVKRVSPPKEEPVVGLSPPRFTHFQRP